MTRGLCGKKCSNCSLFSICGGCDNFDCIVYECIKGRKRMGITDNCVFCRVRFACPEFYYEPMLSIPEVKSYAQRSNFPKLPRFIPEIKISDTGSHFWKTQNVCDPHAIFIKYYELMTSSRLRCKAKVHGIHKALDFNGKVLVSTVMPDELLDRLRPNIYYWNMDQIKPNAITTIDSYTYFSYPLILSWLKTFEVVRKAAKIAYIDSDIPKIGIVKGATIGQVKWCIQSLRKLGFEVLGFPSRELIEERELKFIRKVVKLIKGSGAKCILLGCSSYKKAQETGADSFSGLAWFLNATRRKLYVDGSTINLRKNRSFKCECPSCCGKTAKELIDDVPSMALHNLNYTIELSKSSESFIDRYFD